MKSGTSPERFNEVLRFFLSTLQKCVYFDILYEADEKRKDFFVMI